ncbi:MAG: acyl-CoA dehydrogenase family protein [Spirochaetes bacterium]|nr:acyl-CoA dehydrogenase family protein [Spirochaetota bacterium]
MAKLKYDDLMFNFEKCIPWNEIANALGKENHFDEYMMTMKTVGEVVQEQVEPFAEAIDNDECRLETDSKGKNMVRIAEPMQKHFETLKELGLFCGVTLPEEHGGFDFPLTAFFGFGEIITMGDSSLGLTPMLNEGCAQVISEYANEKIRAEYLPKLISGERLCAMGLTEPSAGSDLVTGIQTTARPADKEKDKDKAGRISELGKLGDVYIINGTKIFISNGYGDVLTLAKINDGISMFLVYEEDKVVPRIEHKLGIRGSATCEIFYDNSPGVLIGELGGGLIPNMLKLMNIARLGVATQGLAIGERAHRHAIEYANDRVQFGVPIIQHSPVRQIIFENELDLQASRVLTYTGAYYFDMRLALSKKLKKLTEGTPEHSDLKNILRKYSRIAEILISLSKYDATELGNRVVDSSLQVFAGYGYTREYPMERFYRDVRITNIYEGTSQIQVDQVFNETFYVDKVGLINQFKLGDGRSFVVTEKNKLFFDIFLDEYKNAIIAKSAGNPVISELLSKVDKIREYLNEARQILFVEERNRGKELGRKYNAIYQQNYVDIVSACIKSYLLVKQALISDHKLPVAKSFIERAVVKAEYCKNSIKSCVDDLIGEAFNKVVRME